MRAEVSPLLVQLVVFVGLGDSFQEVRGSWRWFCGLGVGGLRGAVGLRVLPTFFFNKDFGILRHCGGWGGCWMRTGQFGS